jgi:hypothetical protein
LLQKHNELIDPRALTGIPIETPAALKNGIAGTGGAFRRTNLVRRTSDLNPFIRML